jgi:glycosyltransferase involved in cell wall biosynthesis
MSSLRYDPARRAAPKGFPERPVYEAHIHRELLTFTCGRKRERKLSSFLSVVVPARNEAASLPQLVAQIVQGLGPLCAGKRQTLGGYEIIIVDDGSTDDTPSVLRDLIAVYPLLRAIALPTCGGQSSATVVGIRAARGNWIATLDADLQNDPADLAQLWNALPGHDAALGWRVTRQSHVWRRVLSRWANRARNRVLGQSIHDTGCSVRIFPRAVALRLPAFHGMHRFIGPLLLREGCRLVQVPVTDRSRPYGRSHYNLWNRSIHVVVDLFGVAWLLGRPVKCDAVEILSSHNGVFAAERALGAGNRVPLRKES